MAVGRDDHDGDGATGTIGSALVALQFVWLAWLGWLAMRGVGAGTAPLLDALLLGGAAAARLSPGAAGW